MTPSSLPVPVAAVALVLLGIVIAVTLLVVRQINSGSNLRCTTQGACVDLLDTPYVLRRQP